MDYRQAYYYLHHEGLGDNGRVPLRNALGALQESSGRALSPANTWQRSQKGTRQCILCPKGAQGPFAEEGPATPGDTHFRGPFFS